MKFGLQNTICRGQLRASFVAACTPKHTHKTILGCVSLRSIYATRVCSQYTNLQWLNKYYHLFPLKTSAEHHTQGDRILTRFG